MFKITRLLLLFLVPVPFLLGQPGDSPRAEQTIRLRRPVALVLADEGKLLLVANRASGTVAVLDTRTMKVVAETRVGRKLSDLAANRQRDVVLVADEEAGEVVVLTRQGGTLEELRRIRVGLSPVSVRLSADERTAAVACLWPRRLVFVDVDAARKKDAATVATLAQVDLPFAPRRQVMVPGSTRLIVADAFGGMLAVVNCATKKIESVRTLPVHNISGLALDRAGKNLLLTHQTLNAQGHTTSGEIRTSNVITNNVRKFALAEVLDPLADLSRDDRVYQLGGVERGAGDPAEVADSADGQILVTLAGVHELAIGRPEQALWTHLAVGRAPTALVVDDIGRRAFVANTFADSLSTVDLPNARVIAEVRLGAPVQDLRPEERGEMLFFDARLSFESWYSCHSCHTAGHTTGRLNDNFSDGSFGTPKRILSLHGARDTGPWAWNGAVAGLDAQVRTSLKTTMRGPTPLVDDVRDLTAYLQTLPPPPSLPAARGSLDAETQKRGRKIFTREKCASCHAAPTYTSAKTYDVGLHDEAGGKQFNPPSLRGLSQAGPYFHDNRARTLAEVFTRFRHQLGGELSPEELRDLLHFLESL